VDRRQQNSDLQTESVFLELCKCDVHLGWTKTTVKRIG